MKYLSILFILSFCTFTAIGQVPMILWQKSYGGSLQDEAHSMCLTSDGEFIIAGTTYSSDGDIISNHGDNDVWLLKLDSVGNVLWSKTLGGTNDDQANAIQETYDKGFIVFGSTGSNDYDVSGLHQTPAFFQDGWLIKTDSVGNIEWQKCYGGTYIDYGKDVKVTPDSNYLLAMEASSTDGDILNSHGMKDYWFAKVNQIGSILWSNTYGGPENEAPGKCTILSDNTYVIAGMSTFDFGGHHGISNSQDLGVIKTDSNGNLVRSKCYGGSGGELPYTIIPTDNGGFYIASESTSSDGDLSISYGLDDVWIIKCDSSGSIVWEKSYGGSGYDSPQEIIKTADGGLIVVATTTSTNVWVPNNLGLSDLWIFKLDSMGNWEWGKCLGGSQWDAGSSVKETANGEYIICGNTTSSDSDVTFNHGAQDVWVVKLTSPGLYINNPEYDLMDLSIFQNGNSLIIRFFSRRNIEMLLSVYDLDGKIVERKSVFVNDGINYFEIPLDVSAGNYLLRMEDVNGFSISEKFIRNK